MAEEYKQDWFLRICNRIGLMRFLALWMGLAFLLSVLVGGGLFYVAVKWVVAH